MRDETKAAKDTRSRSDGADWIYSADRKHRRRPGHGWEPVTSVAGSHAAGGTAEEREAKRAKAKAVLSRPAPATTRSSGGLAGLAKASKATTHDAAKEMASEGKRGKKE
jgi:hypothetical protein